MRRVFTSFRLVALFVAAFVGMVLAPGAALAAGPASFSVVADDCLFGYTKGELTWRTLGTPGVPVVDVAGSVYDMRNNVCLPIRDDGLRTTAFFTAYSGTVAVDRAARRVDNGERAFAFTLQPGPVVGTIDHVTIRVCRTVVPGAVAPSTSYCGAPQTFYAPTR
ncbi:hypothetical protein Ga0074812_11796 [Parafrankia irregularis]|uniref:Secreted protein n=1 Tax=Parafrankia irregularis TaxID=795642 RepID=A0A0S4QR23_9ACTN|nr:MULTISPECIES: hypothetical protein [Parafrankia]MBE3205867.1 hypothetical protein [Parafrankia sp. CH37]CUU58187.1 hypothetical protein Ga0074812_11796 [Parafrankia irregularis]